MNDKNAVDQTLIRRLRAVCCPMPGDCEDDPMPGLTIVVNRPEITRAYVMRGWAEYVFAVRITNDSYVPLEIQKFEWRFPWPTRLIWLVDPRIHRAEKQAYRLPQSGREFPCKMVLNDRTGRSGSINPGDSLEGILLAFRKSPRVPIDCLAGSVVPAELSIVDQYGRQYVSQIEVEVDRTAIINSLKLVRRQGRGLYDTSESQASVAVREQARRSVAAEISSDIPDERATPKPAAYQEIPNRSCERQTENLRPYAVRVGSVGNTDFAQRSPQLSLQRDSWRNYDGEPARLRQKLANADANAGKARTGKGTVRT